MCVPVDITMTVAVVQGMAEIIEADGHRRRATFEDIPPRMQDLAKCMTTHCPSCGAPHALDEKRCSYCLTPC